MNVSNDHCYKQICLIVINNLSISKMNYFDLHKGHMQLVKKNIL